MSITITKKYIVLDSITYEPIYLDTLNLAKVVQYIADNPMPEDNAYMAVDLINDIARGKNICLLSDRLKIETVNYLIGMIRNVT
jgi:hypothetical protein